VQQSKNGEKLKFNLRVAQFNI